MRKSCLLFTLLLLLSCLSVCCKEEKTEWGQPDLIASAKQCLEAHARGDFEGAMKNYDEGVRKRVTPAMDRSSWYMGFETKENGAFKRVIGARKAKHDGRDVVFLKCEFEKRILDIQVTFNRSRKITGMGPVPTDSSADYEPVGDVQAGPGDAEGSQTSVSPKAIALSKRFIEFLAKGDFDAAAGDFDEQMAKAAPPKVLQGIWDSLVKKNGAYKGQSDVRPELHQDTIFVFVTCEFERALVDLKVVIDQDNKISGFWIARVRPVDDQAERLGQEFVELLTKGDYDRAAAMFSAEMKTAMTAEQLRGAWEELKAKNGAFKQKTGSKVEREDGYDCVYVTCEFERAKLDVKVVFNEKKEVGGLWFKPFAEYKPPEYADRAAFSETRVVVGKGGEWELPGTLAIPKGDGPFPAVVLVHGSGPNDRDETIGPHKPFKDLAWGLAGRGVAALRYDKRTLVYRGRLGGTEDLTVKEEVIDDALAAVELLRNTERIDRKRVFVLGHSLGGNLVPRIGARDADIAGLISMAGPTRPTEDVLLEQMPYLLSLDGDLSSEDKEKLEALRKQVDRVRDPDLSPDTPASELPHGIPASYWLDLRGYNPAEAAKSLRMPMLILQGARDYQVTVEDFDGWKRHLSDRPDVTLKLYPKLNHHFMVGTGEGKSTPDEYDMPQNVSAEVIDDIAKWIEEHQPVREVTAVESFET